jgi:hypothetical protein
MQTLTTVKKLISGSQTQREPETIIDGRILTLDELWVKGSQLGKVSVEYDTWKEKHKASIQMNIRGSFIIARGMNDDVRLSLLEAIREAEKFSNA